MFFVFMHAFFIISLFQLSSALSGTKCQCDQLVMQTDCVQQKQCTWQGHCLPALNSGSIGQPKESNNCSSFTDPKLCKSTLFDQSSQCWWSDQCIYQEFTKCSTITNAFFCFYKQCNYKNSMCLAPTCSDKLYQSDCNFVGDDDDENHFKICTWKKGRRQGKCQDAEDISHLNRQNCYIYSGGTYYWDQEKELCQACASSPTDLTIALSVSIPLGLILIIGLVIGVKYCVNRKNQVEKKPNKYQIIGPILNYNDIIMEENSKQTFCSICQSIFESTSQVNLTQCKHIFHIECFQLWRKKNKDCPLCHQAI